MSSHHCISSPCWICYPEYAPKQNEKNYKFWQQEIEDHKIPTTGISGIVRTLLIRIFDQGLDEDTHYWEMANLKLSYDDLLKEVPNLQKDTLETELFNMLIEDIKPKDYKENE